MSGRFDSTCWTVVLGAAAGDREDREAFSRRYAPVIQAYLAARWRKPIDHDEVVDGAQEVLLQLFRESGALARVDPARAGGFRPYLYGIARNVALTLERKAASRKSVSASGELDPDTIEAHEATLSHIFDQAWMGMVVDEARSLLEARAADGGAAGRRLVCLRLRYEEEIQPQEIAERLGLKVQAVYDLLKQARQEFRSALFEILASYNPAASEKELEETCRDLVAHL